jgi:hypothetical protein
MGMVVWELIAKGIKPVVFSLTERHLATAMIMHERGWIIAYPKTGLPDNMAEFEDFVKQAPAGRSEPVISGGGTERAASLIEGMASTTQRPVPRVGYEAVGLVPNKER